MRCGDEDEIECKTGTADERVEDFTRGMDRFIEKNSVGLYGLGGGSL